MAVVTSYLGHVPSATAAGLATPPRGPALATYRIELPRGRGGTAPRLVLRHTGGIDEGTPWLGVGWSLDVGQLTRRNPRGGPPAAPYSDPTTGSARYDLSAFGLQTELVRIPPQFGQPDSEVWLKGRRAANLRVVASATSSIFTHWRADLPDGRQLTYDLLRGDPNTQYLVQVVEHWATTVISYERGEPELWGADDLGAHAVYPAEIQYSRDTIVGPGSPPGSFRVRFEYVPRPDPVVEAGGGELRVWNRLLAAIVVEAIGAGDVVHCLRRYQLVHEPDPANGRSLLTSVTRTSCSGDPNLRETRFGYRLPDPAGSIWETQLGSSDPDVAALQFVAPPSLPTGVLLTDINRDGRVDIVQRGLRMTATYDDYSLWVGGPSDTVLGLVVPIPIGDYLNTGGDFDATAPLFGAGKPNGFWIRNVGWTVWADQPEEYRIPFVNGSGGLAGDWDGDGRLEFLRHGGAQGEAWALHYGTPGTVWSSKPGVLPQGVWTLDGHKLAGPSALPHLCDGDTRGVAVVDLNGDGFADVVKASAGEPTETWIMDPVSHTYALSPPWQSPVPLRLADGSVGARIVDLNGDGLPDILSASLAYPELAGVFLNNGRGWTNVTGAFPVIGPDTAQTLALGTERATLLTVGAGVTLPALVDAQGKDVGWRFMDLNADGIVDIVRSIDTPLESFYSPAGKAIGTGGLYCPLPDGSGGYGIQGCPNMMVLHARHALLGQADGSYRWDAFASQVPFNTVIHLPPPPFDATPELAQGLYDQAYTGSQVAVFPGDYRPIDAGTRMGDINGDGVVDAISAHWLPGRGFRRHINHSPPRDELVRQTTPLGATRTFHSTVLTGPGIGRPRQVIDRIDRLDAEGGLVSAQTFKYLDPVLTVPDAVAGPGHPDYDPLRGPELLGFGQVVVTESTPSLEGPAHSVGTGPWTAFRRWRWTFGDRAALRAPLSLDISYGFLGDPEQETPYQRHTYTYASPDQFSAVSDTAPYRQLLARVDVTVWENDPPVTLSTVIEKYDPFGFPERLVYLGIGANPDDDQIIEQHWAHNSQYWLFGFPCMQSVEVGTQRSVQRIFYGSGACSIGDHWAVSRVEEEASPDVGVAYRQFDHDAWGNVIRQVTNGPDPMAPARVTTWGYDTGWRIFPISERAPDETEVEVQRCRINTPADCPEGALGAVIFARSPGLPALGASPRFVTTRYDAQGRAIEQEVHYLNGHDGPRLRWAYDHSKTSGLITTTEVFAPWSASWLARRVDRVDSLGRSTDTVIALHDAPNGGGQSGDRVTETHRLYGPYGRLRAQSTAHFAGLEGDAKWTDISRDPLGRVIRVTDPVQTVRTVFGGLRTTTIDQNGRELTERRDALGRTVRIEDSMAGGATAVFYGAAADLWGDGADVRVVSAGGAESRFWLDGADRITSVVDPDRGTRRIQYNLDGSVVLESYGDGHQNRYLYDDLGRLSAVDEWNDGVVESQLYYDGAGPDAPAHRERTALGLVSAVADAEGLTTLEYGPNGNPVHITRTIDGREFWADLEWDALDRLVARQYAWDGGFHCEELRRRAVGLDGVRFYSSPGAAPVDVLKAVDYDAEGRAVGLAYGNGFTVGRTFGDGLLQRLEAVDGSGVAQLALEYERCPEDDAAARLGYVTRVSDLLEPGASIDLSYDARYRLTGAAGPQIGTIIYELGMDGQLTRRGPWELGYAAPSSHRPLGATNLLTGEAFGYAYDNSGNVVQDGKRTFEYDAFGQVVRLATAAHEVESFYDASGALTRRTWTALDLLGEPTSQKTRLTPFPGLSVQTNLWTGEESYEVDVAGIATRRVAPSGAESLDYAVVNAQGTPLLFASSDGAALSRRRYLPYGEPQGSASSTWAAVGKTQTFLNVDADPIGRLYLTGPRTFDPRIGRFLQPDPILGVADAYQYAYANPIAFADPSGYLPPGDPPHVPYERVYMNSMYLWASASPPPPYDLNQDDLDQWMSEVGAGMAGAVSGVANVVFHPIDTVNSGVSAMSAYGRRVGDETGIGWLGALAIPVSAVLLPAESIGTAMGVLVSGTTRERAALGTSFVIGVAAGGIAGAVVKRVPLSVTARAVVEEGLTNAVPGLPRASKAAPKLLTRGWSNAGFKSAQLDIHFGKHAAEWGAGNITKTGYLKRARSLLGSQPGGNILGHTRPGGDILRYNVRTNEFAVGTADGTIRTLFRPTDGMSYWLKQVGSP